MCVCTSMCIYLRVYMYVCGYMYTYISIRLYNFYA